MKSALKKLLALPFIFLAGGSICLIYNYHYTLQYIPSDYVESTAALSNPYEGWYRIYGYTLSDDQTIDPNTIIASYQEDPSVRLAMLEINLCNYSSGDISPAGLAQLKTVFSTWQQSNKQLIVRFLYDWDGKASETEPKDISIITRHMTQVSDMVNQYKNSIYLLQGIFVGNCGEMNTSSFMSTEDMCTLLKHLASVTDNSIYLSVRTPAHLRTITQSFLPLACDQAFTGSAAARLGLFNDGMLGSGNDLGTYGDTPLSEAASYSDKGTRDDEIQFQNELCKYVPNGGEVVLDNPYNDLENAISDLSEMHISYLDYDYDPAVLSKWKSVSYTGNDNFSGSSGYDYIGNHLGYRYVLKSSSCAFNSWKNRTADLTLTIENKGFSNSYRAFTTSVIVVNTKTEETYPITVDTDNRYWDSKSPVSFSLPLDIRHYQEGVYHIYLKITDPSTNEQIRLANTLDQSDYGYQIASMTIKK